MLSKIEKEKGEEKEKEEEEREKRKEFKDATVGTYSNGKDEICQTRDLPNVKSQLELTLFGIRYPSGIGPISMFS